jgi:[acyl-carrier-protein] S-malonyltransferase
MLRRKVALLFPGQGAQYVGMGADIYTSYSCAKYVIDECNDVIGGGLREIMFNGPHSDLTRTSNAQPGNTNT